MFSPTNLQVFHSLLYHPRRNWLTDLLLHSGNNRQLQVKVS